PPVARRCGRPAPRPPAPPGRCRPATVGTVSSQEPPRRAGRRPRASRCPLGMNVCAASRCFNALFSRGSQSRAVLRTAAKRKVCCEDSLAKGGGGTLRGDPVLRSLWVVLPGKVIEHAHSGQPLSLLLTVRGRVAPAPVRT